MLIQKHATDIVLDALDKVLPFCEIDTCWQDGQKGVQRVVNFFRSEGLARLNNLIRTTSVIRVKLAELPIMNTYTECNTFVLVQVLCKRSRVCTSQ